MHGTTRGVSVLLGISVVFLASEASATGTFAAALAVGLSPEPMAAAGMTNAQCGALLTGLTQAQNLRNELDSAMAATHAKVVLYGIAEAKLREDPTNATSRAAVEATRLQVAQARQTAQIALAALRSQVILALPQAVAETLVRVQKHSALRLPAAYIAVDRPALALRKLELALNAEARALGEGQTVSAEVASLLTAVRSESAFVAAQSNSGLWLPAIQQTFVTMTAP